MANIHASVESLPLAFAEGPALDETAQPLPNLVGALLRAVEIAPNKGIRYLYAEKADEFQTYPALFNAAACVLTGLRELGIKPGDKVIFQLPDNRDFLAGFWACLLGGFVPVPISLPPGYDQPHNILAKLQNAWVLLDQPIVLAGQTVAQGLGEFARRQNLLGFRVEVIDPLRSLAPAHSFHASGAEDLALLLLTSGSTGLPKGVQLSHRNILSRCAATRLLNGFNADSVSINWMPLDHVGGVVMFHLRDVFLGCDQIHAPTEIVLQEPLKWLDWVDRYRVTNTWAPNFAFGLINDQAEAIARGKWDLTSLTFILNAGEAIVSRTARKFLTLLAPHGLPAIAMRPAWGMSETSSGVTYSHRFTLATTNDATPFVDVGQPIPGFAMRIVDRNGQMLPEGKIGSLQVKGLTITAGYYKNPKLNAEVFTSDGWFITGDLGIIKSGQLTITGREKDIIIVNGVNFHSHEIESVVEEVSGVEISFTAACAVRPSGENTDRIAIFFSPAAEAADRLPELIKSIRSAVVSKEGVNPDYVLPVSNSAIPKTAIGKIQRSQLRQQFERGDYADLVRKYSSQANEPARLPEWFFRPSWHEAPLSAGQIPLGKSFLFFADRAGLAARLAQQLTTLGASCALIHAGDGFAQSGPSSFTVAPGKSDDVARVLKNLPTLPDVVVHAWTYDVNPGVASADALEQSQNLSSIGLITGIQGLILAGAGAEPVRLLAVSRQTRPVKPQDPISLAAAPILGAVRTFQQEISWLESRHIDLDQADAATDSKRIFSELSEPNTSPEIAWRGETRWASCIEPVDTKGTEETAFKTGGLYVITGGLGGVAQAIASGLVQQFDAKLLLLSRTALPPRAEWPRLLAASGRDAERIQTLDSLEAQGAEVALAAVDVSDEVAVEKAVSEAEARWGQPLAGVLHLAGIYHEASLEQESPDRLRELLRPKLGGAWALTQVARRRPGCLVVNFSSAISFFGTQGTGAYAVANNGLDGFAAFQRSAHDLRAYSILWSSWTGLGMSRQSDAGDILRSRGYLPLSGEQGFASLVAALRQSNPLVLVGLDGNNRGIQKQLHPAVTAARSSPLSENDGYIAPRSPIEVKIAQVWQEILSVPRVGADDHFFELGGRSLLAAKMFSQLHKALGKNLPVPALFKAPTLGQLAKVYAEQSKTNLVKIDALQTRGFKVPVFLIPEAGATAESLRALAELFAPDQPLFVVQPKALAPSASSTSALTQSAEASKALATEIAALIPGGKCLIAGRSIGSALAWEAARLLTGQGISVVSFVVFDAPPATLFSRESGVGAVQFSLARDLKNETGFLGRLFKKSNTAADPVSRELKQLRARYGESTLAAAAMPVVIFGTVENQEPWSALSSRGVSLHPLAAQAEVLASLAV